MATQVAVTGKTQAVVTPRRRRRHNGMEEEKKKNDRRSRRRRRTTTGSRQREEEEERSPPSPIFHSQPDLAPRSTWPPKRRLILNLLEMAEFPKSVWSDTMPRPFFKTLCDSDRVYVSLDKLDYLIFF